jgi:hypothetical protein
MSIGSGIAIAGIWIGVGIMTWAEPAMGFIRVLCALFPTLGIAEAGSQPNKSEAS